MRCSNIFFGPFWIYQFLSATFFAAVYFLVWGFQRTHFAEYFNNSEDIIGNGDIKKTDVSPEEKLEIQFCKDGKTFAENYEEMKQ